MSEEGDSFADAFLAAEESLARALEEVRLGEKVQ